MAFLQGIKDYWQIIAFIGSLIWAWSKLNSRDNEQERRITNLETSSTILSSSQLEIKTSMARIEIAIEFIKQQLLK